MSAPSDRTAGPLLLDLATVTALITALVYFTGWTYAYHYFSYFKLGLLTLEIPTEYFFCVRFLGLQKVVVADSALCPRRVALNGL
jgi:hypothetical protein